MRLLFSLLLVLPVRLLAQQPGDQLFSAPQVHTIDILLSQPSWWDSLMNNKALSDQTGTDIYIRGDVIVDGDTLHDVGVKLKGNASFNHPGRKKSIKISFNEYVPGQDLDNLKSIHLNNSAYDPTMLREKIYLDILNRNGVHAPRCAFASVSYNHVYCGLFRIVEPVDKTFLQTHFNHNDWNLYKGDPDAPLTWEGNNQQAYYDNFELKTNETVNDWSDLVHLIDVINNSGSGFASAVSQEFDMNEYIRVLAANNLFGNLDSYLYLPHNYYLYHDSISNRFRWITWDVNVVFGVLPENFLLGSNQSEFDLFYLPDPPSSLPLNANLFAVPQFHDQYLNEVCYWKQQEFATSKLFPVIDSLAGVIRPYVYAEADSNRMYTLSQFEGNLGYQSVSLILFAKIPGLRDFISKRQGNVQQQLCDKQWSCVSGSSYAGISDGGVSFFTDAGANMLTVRFSVPEYNVRIHYSIADLSGRQLASEDAFLENGSYEKQFDISGFRSGAYVLGVDTQCRHIQRKMVIVR